MAHDLNPWLSACVYTDLEDKYTVVALQQASWTLVFCQYAKKCMLDVVEADKPRSAVQ